MNLFDQLYNDAVDNGRGDKPLLDSAFRKRFEQLHDFIVKRSHNKLKREHGRVTLTAEGDHFKIIISDPTGECSFALLCDSIEDGLRSMENHAANSAIHWYYWGKGKKEKAVATRTSSTAGTGKAKRTRKK